MPTGPFERRRLENDFNPEKKEKYMIVYHWLDWVSETQHINIQHKLNQGKEKKIGPYPVDGYDESNHVIYQFQVRAIHSYFQCMAIKKRINQKLPPPPPFMTRYSRNCLLLTIKHLFILFSNRTVSGMVFLAI